MQESDLGRLDVRRKRTSSPTEGTAEETTCGVDEGGAATDHLVDNWLCVDDVGNPIERILEIT